MSCVQGFRILRPWKSLTILLSGAGSLSFGNKKYFLWTVINITGVIDGGEKQAPVNCALEQAKKAEEEL